MILESVLDFQEGDCCRVFRCDSFEHLGPIQILFIADKLSENGGMDAPCLSVKTKIKGAIITANQFFEDSEDGETARDRCLELLNEDRASKFLEEIELERMLSLLNEEVGEND